MVRKAAVCVGLVAVGIIVGAVLPGLVQKHEQSSPQATQAYPRTPEVERDKAIEALKAEYAPQIEQLIKANEILRNRLSMVGLSEVARPKSLTEARAQFAAMVDKADAEKKKRTVEMLLAAGYSPDRIEWLRSRSEELQRQRRLAESEQRAKGLPVDPVKEMAYVFDKDIELRYEIGDVEYERFLRALGKPTSVQVTEVLPSSIAYDAGIKTGDVILDYDSKRLFNQGELDGMAMGRNGTPAAMTVNRNGAILKFVVPGGPIGVRSIKPNAVNGSLAP